MLDTNRFSILVISCDRYADAWPVFFEYFWKYWPGCPEPVYLGANREVYGDARVKMVLAGDDLNWAQNARKMVAQIPDERLLILLEDFLLYKPVDTEKINRLFDAFVALDASYLRLRKLRVRPDVRMKAYPEIGILHKGAPYRLNLQAAFWKKQIFLDLLKDGESAWEMELAGSERSNIINGFYGTWRTELPYYSGITHGKWIYDALWHSKRDGLQLDLNTRPLMPPIDYIRLMLHRILFALTYLFPKKLRQKMKKNLQRFGFLRV